MSQGTGTISGGGMAFYDAYTASAAATALGRPLASFWTQDESDPMLHAEDVAFLASATQEPHRRYPDIRAGVLSDREI